MLKLLVIEDVEADYQLVLRHLRMLAPEVNCHRVFNTDDLIAALQSGSWDAVLSDYHLPAMDFLESLGHIKHYLPEVPVILVSGEVGEETAVALLKQGVCDFVLKDHLARLPSAIERGIQEKQEQMARRTAEEELRLSKERFELALHGANEGVWDWELQTDYVYYSPRWKMMLGYEDGELENHLDTWKSLSHPDDIEPTLRLIHEMVQSRTDKIEAEFRLRHKKGHYLSILFRGIFISDGQGSQRLVGTHVDLSELKAAHARIEHMAHHDPLTDLPNRALLLDRLQQSIHRTARAGRQLAVVFLDLDNFKNINESLGHAAGDRLLKEIAGRLFPLVRAEDTIARLGGDEFVLVLTSIEGAPGVTRVSTLIFDALGQPFVLENQRVQMSASIGISIYPDDGTDGPTLLRNADNAMYAAKASGRSRCCFFSPEMDTQAHQRFQTEVGLRAALLQQQFSLHYQPQLDAFSKQVLGIEALLRWEHPDQGTLNPAKFLQIAEDTGLIVPVGTWVLTEACKQCRLWHDTGYKVNISVNISARQLQQENFVEIVADILHECQLPGEYLELELTESILVEPTEQTLVMLQNLRDLKVRIAVDDFGTGYSCLSYLKSYPISTLKIAQCFVDDIATNEVDRSITEAIVALARALGLTTVAEGVENAKQAQILHEIGVDLLQGYHCSRPVPASMLFQQ